VSNYWKYFIGQQPRLEAPEGAGQEEAQEDELMAWVNADASRKAKYGDIVTLTGERLYGARQVREGQRVHAGSAFRL
jgi:hypothetical protein